MSRRRLRICAAVLACALAAVALAAPAPSARHPLGNFTINQLAQVRIDDRDAQVHYVLDQAEIPTFQQLQRYDADGSGAIDTAPEESQVLQSLLGEISSGLALTANGRTVAARPARGPAAQLPARPGRAVADPRRGLVRGPAPGRRRHVELTNNAFTGHVGWRRDPDPARRRHRRHARASRPPTRPTACAPTPRTCCRARQATARRASRSARVGPGDGPAGPLRRRGDDRLGALDGFANALAGGNTARPADRVPARRGIRLGGPPRALARPRQDDGRRLPGRRPRHPAARGDPRRSW